MMAATILFMCLTVIPAFLGRLGSAPTWLAAQGLVLGWIGLLHEGQPGLHAILVGLEAVLIRGVLAPWLLRRSFHRSAGQNLELLPSNLFTWAIGIALVALAAQFGSRNGVDPHSLVVGAVGIAIVVALLLLATSQSDHVQLVALLFFENAIALYETQLPEPWPLPVHIGLSAIYVLTVFTAAWLIGAALPVETADSAEGRQ